VLPAWSHLRDSVVERCRRVPQARALLAYLDPQQQRLRRPVPAALRRLLRALSGGGDLERVVLASDADASAFLVDQICRNAEVAGEDEPRAGLLFKRHNQLPCTAATLERRIAAVRRHVGLGAPILIVGDDDLQSVALAREGFTDLTVIEIDEAVARQIATAAQAHPGAITILREDIGAIRPLGRAFAAILMDPPVNIGGARAFLDGAVRAAGGGETTLFLNTHLLSYGEAGYQELLKLLDAHGFKALELHLAFSRYAIPTLPRAGLNALLRVVEPSVSTRLRFFVSDLLVLRRED
jgi:hypothetical protein